MNKNDTCFAHKTKIRSVYLQQKKRLIDTTSESQA